MLKSEINSNATVKQKDSAGSLRSWTSCGYTFAYWPHRGQRLLILKKTTKRTAASRKRSPERRVPVQRARAEKAIVAFSELADSEGIRWYLFGAQAVAIYGVPRTTNDIDITIQLGERSLSSIVDPLRNAGFTPLVTSEGFHRETRIYPVFHKRSGWKVDLVLAGTGIEEIFLESAHVFHFKNKEIRVVAPEHLVALKILASRPKDLEDVRGLIRIADLDHARVDETLRTLEQLLDQSDLRPVYARLRQEAKPQKLRVFTPKPRPQPTARKKPTRRKKPR